MILEEIDGDVKVVLNGKTLTIGSNFDENDYSLVVVIGKGKAIFRTSPSTTTEQRGVETSVEEIAVPTPTPTPAPVEAAPVAELVPSPMETPAENTEEPAKK